MVKRALPKIDYPIVDLHPEDDLIEASEASLAE
jgi:hypothetical protein